MPSRPLKIDVHTHILPKDWPDLRERYGYGGWIQLEHHCPGCARMMSGGKFFREIEANCWDPGVRMNECTSSGVDVQVLSTVPVMFGYWAKPEHALDLAQRLNDHIAGVVREHPTRFEGLGSVPLQSPDLAIQEMRRCVNELGLRGIEIGTHVNDWNLDAPELFPVFEEAARLGASVFVHPWDMMAKEKMPKFWLPWLVGMPAESSLALCSLIFGGVFERLPDLRVLVAHGGGSFPMTIGRIDHGFHVRPDLCATECQTSPRDQLGRFYLDSLVHDEAALRYLVELVGADKIALGTDYPFPLGELEPGRLVETTAGLTDAQRARILGGTALEFLGLPADAHAGGSPARSAGAN